MAPVAPVAPGRGMLCLFFLSLKKLLTSVSVLLVVGVLGAGCERVSVLLLS